MIQGRFDAFRSGSVCSPLPEADFRETDQNCLYAWGMDYVCGNGVMEKDGERFVYEYRATSDEVILPEFLFNSGCDRLLSGVFIQIKLLPAGPQCSPQQPPA